jgi:hypothetical protein
MDGLTDGLMDRQTDRQINRQLDGQEDRRTDRRTGRQTDRQTARRTTGHTDRETGRRTNRPINTHRRTGRIAWSDDQKLDMSDPVPRPINHAVSIIKRGIVLDFYLCMYFIQHCFICRPSDSPLCRRIAGIEPRAVTTSALAVRRSIATLC